MNYILIHVNKIYEDLYDLLDEKELTMNNLDHHDMIKFHIEKYIEKINYIKMGEYCDTPEERLNKIMEDLSDNTGEHMEGNTLLVYSDDKIMYEIVFLENSKNQTDINLNDFGSITNIELYPIYGDCVIIKTRMQGKTLINDTIDRKDLFNIIYNNFYHTGVMINSNNDIKELIFSGDVPSTIIGNTFKTHYKNEIFGLQFIIYQESDNDSFKNELVSKLCNKDIYGRTFLCLLSPIFNKKFFNNKISILKLVTSLLEDIDKRKNIEKELGDDKITNPFIVLSKYK